MKLSEYYQLLKDNEEKIQVIDQIMEFHPSYGGDFGWSTYIGGMADTGRWFPEKMLTVNVAVLKMRLKEWCDERDKPRKEDNRSFGEKYKDYRGTVAHAFLFGDITKRGK
jgi:hypothetical protein